ncbi:hypothetical protein Q1695_002021 [Nippostrongylus brasiliensis]|nr:hypothetical protein Q1695_002021 [Nippostrongylus brasiliensis]
MFLTELLTIDSKPGADSADTKIEINGLLASVKFDYFREQFSYEKQGLGATIVDQIGAKASLDLDATINKGTSKSSSSKPTTIRLPESTSAAPRTTRKYTSSPNHPDSSDPGLEKEFGECQVGMIRKHCFRVCPATCSHAATCRAVQCSRKGRCMCRGGLVQATISYPILGCVPKILCPVARFLFGS